MVVTSLHNLEMKVDFMQGSQTHTSACEAVLSGGP